MATQGRSPRLKDEPDDDAELTQAEKASAGDAAPADDPRKTQKAPPEVQPLAKPDPARVAADATVEVTDEIPRFRVPQGFFDGEKLWPPNSEINWFFKYHPSLVFVPLNQAAKTRWDAAKKDRDAKRR